MGVGGSYYTMQFAHLFLFAAKVNGLTSFTVNTNYANGGTFETLTVTSSQFVAYCQRYYGLTRTTNTIVMIDANNAVTSS
jgi:hypothetical protein